MRAVQAKMGCSIDGVVAAGVLCVWKRLLEYKLAFRGRRELNSMSVRKWRAEQYTRTHFPEIPGHGRATVL